MGKITMDNIINNNKMEIIIIKIILWIMIDLSIVLIVDNHFRIKNFWICIWIIVKHLNSSVDINIFSFIRK